MSRGRAHGLRAIAPVTSRNDSRTYFALYSLVQVAVSTSSELEALAVLGRVKAEAELMTWRGIDDARAAGIGWESIGQALGMTRQGAQQLYGRKLAVQERAERLSGV